MYKCPDCKCHFVQPFKCTTCGAQRLYDRTVISLEGTVESLELKVTQLEEQLRQSHLAYQNIFDKAVKLERALYGLAIDNE